MSHTAQWLAAPRPAAAPELPQLHLWSHEAGGPVWAEALAEEGFRLDHRLLGTADGPSAPCTGAGAAAANVVVLSGALPPQLPLLRWLLGRCPEQAWLVIGEQMRPLDQVMLLELGADDALPVQVPPMVIAAKLRRLLHRRSAPPAGGAATARAELRLGSLRLALRGRSAACGETPLPLTEGEFEILWLLTQQPGQVASREWLLHHTRGLAYDPRDRSIDSRIYRLRRKLAAAGPGAPRVHAVRHQGYALSLAA
jgi:two-component system, OmpR family, response regulator RstA